MACLGKACGGLDLAEALLDALFHALAQGTSRMAGGAAVDPSLTPPANLDQTAIDGDVRRGLVEWPRRADQALMLDPSYQPRYHRNIIFFTRVANLELHM